MDFKSQACLINEFLIQYSQIWAQEVMDDYPKTIEYYPDDWIQDLAKLSQDELFEIDSKQSFAKIECKSLQSFIETIQKLSFVPKKETQAEIPLEDWAFAGVKHKKRHEIQKIVPTIKQIFQQYNFDHINDIGGGVGHLARILAHYHSIPAFSIDQNQNFQDSGAKRMERYRKIPAAAKVTFINLKFGEKHPEVSKRIFSPVSFSLGLHTCGSLAIKLIEENLQYKTLGVLSFGCCYHLINEQDKHNADFYISDYYQKNQFQKINLYGRTLATRSHAENNYANYLKKIKVKSYRYGFHLFMMKHFGRKDLVDIGECHLSIYDRPVSSYIFVKLSDLKIEHNYQAEYIENFFYSKEIQSELKTMILCNIIRWQMGRVLEVFLLLDRCLKLAEEGQEVQMEQYFEESLSPRNIGILSLRKHSGSGLFNNSSD
jgi:hypothetical protein